MNPGQKTWFDGIIKEEMENKRNMKMENERCDQSLVSSLIKGQTIFLFLHFGIKHTDVKMLIINCKLHEVIMDIGKQ